MYQEKNRGTIIIYKNSEGESKIEVKMDGETVWLSQEQISQLFTVDRSVITKHINNIFKSGELKEKSNVQKMHIPNSDKPVKYFSLDMIISIGYRTNSIKATEFRIWANQILKNYLTKGYAINKQLLEEQNTKLKDIQNAIKFINDKKDSEILIGQSGELISLIQEFANSFSILHEYDEEKLKLNENGQAKFILNYDQAKNIITDFKAKLTEKGEAGSLMGSEIENKFKGVVGSLYQTYDGIDLYASLEEKAANLLYLTIKDHPFSDGNKRIGSFLFIYFLSQNNYLYKASGEKKINDNALVALALLVAVSDPRDKEIMIKIISNLLV
jgi:prophage maintenance system killer protein